MTNGKSSNHAAHIAGQVCPIKQLGRSVISIKEQSIDC
ncbi:MAG: hypothetical protein ANABAC_1868 [Anaerolineae bacterium]|nr:MAG: hypothetical protein ANABAC_1868 [Anaerolineae bacterium]